MEQQPSHFADDINLVFPVGERCQLGVVSLQSTISNGIYSMAFAPRS